MDKHCIPAMKMIQLTTGDCCHKSHQFLAAALVQSETMSMSSVLFHHEPNTLGDLFAISLNGMKIDGNIDFPQPLADEVSVCISCGWHASQSTQVISLVPACSPRMSFIPPESFSNTLDGFLNKEG